VINAAASQNAYGRSKLAWKKGMDYTIIMSTFRVKRPDWPIGLNEILKELEVIA